MLWVKALHIISMVCWFAMLFYLPRLFVYHAMSEDQTSKDRFKVMERKLYFGIGTPAMIATIVFGVWLVVSGWGYLKSQGWLHIKFVLVFFLVGYHHMCGAYVKKFARDETPKGHVFFRWFNEIPVVFLIVIVILAVVRPF